LQNILQKVVKKFGEYKERVVSLYQAITLITLKQNIMNTFSITFKNNKGTLTTKDFQFKCNTVNKCKEIFEDLNNCTARSITKH